nr:MAG TPA: putative DNA-binding protein [Caudoviricetes sp.]
MKVKVKQKFRDKYTGDIRFAGEIVEMPEERYIEINAKKNGLVEKVEEKTEETQTPETTKPEAGSVEAPEHPESSETAETKVETPNELTKSTLEKMKVDELRKKAEEMGVDSMGKKEELIKRILGEEENVDEES